MHIVCEICKLALRQARSPQLELKWRPHMSKTGGSLIKLSWTIEAKPYVLKRAVILHVQMSCRFS